MVDYALQRLNMVESQVRPNGITDPRIIEAMFSVPRERFVPEGRRSLAYMDEDLAIGTMPDGARRYLIQPMVLGRLLQLAAPRADEILLDIGCGTGYSSAVAASLVESVIGLEENAGLARIASDVLAEIGVTNAVVVQGPHAQGVPAEAPFDVVLINGRIPAAPAALIGQLKPGGRLVAVVGEGPMARATVFRPADAVIGGQAGFDAYLPPLPGFEAPAAGFVF